MHINHNVSNRMWTGSLTGSTSVVQQKKDSSKTAVKQSYTNSTRQFLENGPLRYEMDLYNLIKSIFYEKINNFGIKISNSEIPK